jgi:hypothetical protein
MKFKNTLLGIVAVTTLAFVPGSLIAQGPPPPRYGNGFAQQQPWEAPPSEYQDVQRRGFHDGIEGARKDFQNHRRPNVNNRDEYRHPNVSHRDRRAYREAFRRGYDVGVQHLMNGPRR